MAKQREYLGTQHRARVPPALGQHVHVELALADVISKVVHTILECLGVDIACISTTHTACSGCCGSCSLRDCSFMLNSAGTHHSIYSSVCHSTSSTKSHALSYGRANTSKN